MRSASYPQLFDYPLANELEFGMKRIQARGMRKLPKIFHVRELADEIRVILEYAFIGGM
jgi:hypothetical protein